MRPTTARARSREQRSARIEQVALELFRSRGFDQVTVEDVCAGAGVGPATFYRHFGTKEGVVFSYRNAFTTALRTAIDAAADLPEPARLTAVLSQFAGFLESQSEMLALRDEIVLGHGRLLERTLIIQREMEAALADGLARLRGLPQVDTAAQLEAGLGVLVLRVAVRSWRMHGGTSLPDAVQEVRARLCSLVCFPSEPGSTSEAGHGPEGSASPAHR
jgi:AcrR family transcriptional regulator